MTGAATTGGDAARLMARRDRYRPSFMRVTRWRLSTRTGLPLAALEKTFSERDVKVEQYKRNTGYWHDGVQCSFVPAAVSLMLLGGRSEQHRRKFFPNRR